MRIRSLFLLALLVTCGAAPLRTADAPPAVRRLHIDPSSTQIMVGEARLSVDPLTRGGDGFSGSYRLEVSPVPIGNESGKLSVSLSDQELRQLVGGQTIEFTGQAVSTGGNNSELRVVATPKGNSGGALRIHIASKKGKLVFHTSYHLDH